MSARSASSEMPSPASAVRVPDVREERKAVVTAEAPPRDSRPARELLRCVKSLLSYDRSDLTSERRLLTLVLTNSLAASAVRRDGTRPLHVPSSHHKVRRGTR